MKQKANISIELQASNVTNGLDLDHDLDLRILKVKCDLDFLPHIWPGPWIFMVKFWNSCIWEWVGGFTLHKGVGSRSFMTMTMTIWWPRSGVWIYPIVTGVTSVFGVPSTHLVMNRTLHNTLQWNLNENTNTFISRKCVWKFHLQIHCHFVMLEGCWNTG